MGAGNVVFNIITLIVVIALFVAVLSMMQNQPVAGDGLVRDTNGAFNVNPGTGIAISNGKVVAVGITPNQSTKEPVVPKPDVDETKVGNGYDFKVGGESMFEVSRNEVTIQDDRSLIKLYGVTRGAQTVTLTKTGTIDPGTGSSVDLKRNCLVFVTVKTIGSIVGDSRAPPGTTVVKEFDFAVFVDKDGHIHIKSDLNDNVISDISRVGWDINVSLDDMKFEIQVKGLPMSKINWISFVDCHELDVDPDSF